MNPCQVFNLSLLPLASYLLKYLLSIWYLNSIVWNNRPSSTRGSVLDGQLLSNDINCLNRVLLNSFDLLLQVSLDTERKLLERMLFLRRRFSESQVPSLSLSASAPALAVYLEEQTLLGLTTALQFYTTISHISDAGII